MNREMIFNAKEAEILQLVADGFSPVEIADVLFVSEEMVEGHCRKMVRKAGARNTADLVRITSEAGLLNEFPVELKKNYYLIVDPNSESVVHQNAVQRLLQGAYTVIKHVFSPRNVMKKAIFLCLAMLVGFALPAASIKKAKKVKQVIHSNIPGYELKTGMRKLMEDRVALTRNVIFALVDNRFDVDSAVNDMVKNQAEIADLMSGYYGDKAGKELTKLLYRDITLAADVMIACRNGHSVSFERAEYKWKESANDLAEFFSKYNSTWKTDEVSGLIDDEIKYTTDEMMAIKNNDNNNDEQSYNRARLTMLAIADSLSEDIIKHFPERFREVETVAPSLGQK